MKRVASTADRDIWIVQMTQRGIFECCSRISCMSGDFLNVDDDAEFLACGRFRFGVVEFHSSNIYNFTRSLRNP